eukprot:scaffold6931_cov114-Amphora_coffeaeformis.AAC.1
MSVNSRDDPAANGTGLFASVESKLDTTLLARKSLRSVGITERASQENATREITRKIISI